MSKNASRNAIHFSNYFPMSDNLNIIKLDWIKKKEKSSDQLKTFEQLNKMHVNKLIDYLRIVKNKNHVKSNSPETIKKNNRNIKIKASKLGYKAALINHILDIQKCLKKKNRKKVNKY